MQTIKEREESKELKVVGAGQYGNYDEVRQLGTPKMLGRISLHDNMKRTLN